MAMEDFQALLALVRETDTKVEVVDSDPYMDFGDFAIGVEEGAPSALQAAGENMGDEPFQQLGSLFGFGAASGLAYETPPAKRPRWADGPPALWAPSPEPGFAGAPPSPAPSPGPPSSTESPVGTKADWAQRTRSAQPSSRNPMPAELREEFLHNRQALFSAWLRAGKAWGETRLEITRAKDRCLRPSVAATHSNNGFSGHGRSSMRGNRVSRC